MEKRDTDELLFIDGNTATAMGAVAAGCDFFAGYPITPATSIYNFMLNHLPPAGGICIQTEDEIAAIGMCLGAAAAGKKAMTATSGPGLSLFSEQISFATGSEIPLVIVDVQRLGPSTGAATKGADGDINFMRWGNMGGFPVIVLSPVDTVDCFWMAKAAFHLSQALFCPVFLASNKEVGLTKEVVEKKRLEDYPGKLFEIEPADALPDRAVIAKGPLCRITSSIHGPDGYITQDPSIIDEGQKRLEEKIESVAEQLFLYDLHTGYNAETLVITYGVTAKAAAAATGLLEKEGRKASLMVIKTLFPVAPGIIREVAAGYDRILVVEMNMGQYLYEIKRILGDRRIDFLGRMNGELIRPEEILEAILR